MKRTERDQQQAEAGDLQNFSLPLAEPERWRGLEPLEPRLLLSAVIDYNPLDTFTDDDVSQVLEQEAESGDTDTTQDVTTAEDDVPVFSLEDTDEALSFSTFTTEPGDEDAGELDSITTLTVDEPLRPVLILPGIGGTLWADGHEDEWYTTRGIHPDKLVEDPLAGVYDDFAASLENVGYTRGEDLFVANYDWRMSPGPRPDGPSDIDGVVEGLTAESITDDTFGYGVDYLGYWLEQAADAWQAAGKGVLDAVDIVAHSTGGMVARSYLQADFYETDTTLPKVHNFLMAAVPNRGASKAWNPLNNNWGVDPAMRVVLSKIGYEGYERVMEGQTITGADGETITAADFDGMSEEDAQLAFIQRYVPTVNDLLATYDFLFDGDDASPTLENINDPTHEHSGLRNSLALDLNDGLDLHYAAEDIAADGTWTDPVSGHVYRPNSFVDALQGGAYAVYNDQVPTITTVSSQTGPIDGETNLIVPMDRFIGSPPEAGEEWFKDHGADTDEPGDGTVPLASLSGQFVNDSRVQLVNLDDSDEAVNHTGMLHDAGGQQALIDILLADTDISYGAGDISTQLAPNTYEMLLNVVAHNILNPSELLESDTLHDELAESLAHLSDSATTFVLRAIGGGGFVNAIPGLDLHIREATGLDEIIDDFAFGTFRSWLGSFNSPDWVEPTTDALVDAWLAYDGITTGSGLTLAVDQERTFGGRLSSTDAELAEALELEGPAGADQLVLNFALTADASGSAPLDLGFDGELLELLGATEVDYSASATFDVTIGYVYHNSIAAEDRVFIRVNELSAEVDLDVTEIEAAARFGFVEGEVYDGHLLVNGSLDARFAHADDDSQKRLTQALIDEGLDDEAWLRGNFITDKQGTMEASLPARVTVGNYTTGAGPRVEITSANIFDTRETEYAYVDFEELWAFTALDAGTVMDLFQRTLMGLAEANESALLATPIPFAQGLTVGDLLDFERAVDESIVSHFVDDDGYFTFDSLEQFVGQLATAAGVDEADLNLDYDPATQELSYRVPFSLAYTPDAVQFNLGVDAGPLFDLRSGGLVELSALVEGGFTVGMELTPIEAVITGERDVPADGQLSSTARFDLAIGSDDPVTVVVSRDHENESIDDLVEDVNAALVAAGVADRVAARRSDEDANRIELHTVGRWTGSASLRVTNPNSVAENQLGLNPLHMGGDAVRDRAYLEDVSLSGEIGVTADDVNAFGRFGFLDIDIDGASGSVTATADYELVNPDDGGSRIALMELADHLREDAAATIGGAGFAGSAQAVLPISVNPNPFGSDHPEDPTITLTWSDLTDTDTIDLSYNAAMEELAGYGELDFATIVGAVGDMADFLGEQMENLPWLSEDLPLLNRSVAEIFDIAGDFADKVAAIADDPSVTLDQLADRLAAGLGIDPEDVTLALESDMLRFDLGLSEMFSTEIPLQLDLVELFADDLPDSLAGLANMVTAGTDGKLTIAAEAIFDVALGFDLSDPQQPPTPVVFDSTGFNVGLNVTGEDLEGELGIDGLAAVYILDGSAFIGDESDEKDMARFMAGLSPASAGWYALGDLTAGDFDVSLSGSASTTLPLYFPTESDPLRDEDDPADAHHLVLSVGDLSDPLNTASVSAPDLAGLLDGLTLRDQLGYLVVGLDFLLEQIQHTLEGDVFSQDLPIIGDQLANAGEAIENLREGILTDLRAALAAAPAKATDVVRDKLFEVLGPDGLGVLGDLNADEQITVDDVLVPIDETDEVQFHLLLTPASIDLGNELEFDLALPGLELDLNVNPQVALDLEMDLVFGVSSADGFYFDTSGDQVTAALEVTIPDSTFSGRLAFLDLAVEDMGSGAGAAFHVDVIAPGNRLRWDEIINGDGLSVDAGLSGGANLDLALTVSFNGVAAMPSLGARFVADWNFDLNGVDAPTIAFEDVTLDPGEFINNFVGPILDQIQDIIGPIQPLIDFFNTELPVISDLMGEMTVLDLIDFLPDRWAFVDGEMLQALAGLLDVVDTLSSIPVVDGDVLLDLGSFDLTGADGLSEVGGLLDFDPNVTSTPSESPLAQFAALSSEHEDFADSSGDLNGTGSGLEFPLLSDPARAFRVLLGQPVELFTFDMPHIEFLLEFSQDFLVWTPPDISINLSGELGGRIDLGFGYDTTGLMRYRDTGEVSDILTGFYISDRANADGTGADVPEAMLWGSLLVGLKAGFAGAGIGAYGGLRATLYGDLNDPNNDGKVHVHEFVRSARNGEEGLWCTFDLTGEVSGVLGVYFELAGEQVREELVNVVLWDFSIFDGPCFPGRFEANETPNIAADLGAAPGVHIVNGRIIDEYDRDWYSFDLLREDSVEIVLEHDQGQGDLDVEIYDADNNRIARAKSQTDDERIVLKNLEPGRYYMYAFGSGDPVDYTINIDPFVDGEDPASSQTNLYYVADPEAFYVKWLNYYATEPGDDVNNDGRSHDSPLATIGELLSRYTLGPNDMVLIDGGRYNETVVLGGDHVEAIVAGAPIPHRTLQDFLGEHDLEHEFLNPGGVVSSTIIGPSDATGLRIDGATGLLLHSMEVYNAEFAGAASGNTLQHSRLRGDIGVHFLGGADDDPSDNTVQHNVFASSLGVRVDSAAAQMITQNTFQSLGVHVTEGAAADIVDNTFEGSGPYGVRFEVGAVVTLQENDITGYDAGVINHSFDVTFVDNRIFENTVGMTGTGLLGAQTAGDASEIFENEIGVVLASGTAGAIVQHNEIYDNDTGVLSEGSGENLIQGNIIRSNVVGIEGGAVVGGADWTAPNEVYQNLQVGIVAAAEAEIRFNRVHGNPLGIRAADGAHVHHNVVFRGEVPEEDGVPLELEGHAADGDLVAILLQNARDVFLENNTIYAPIGHAVVVAQSSRDARLRNNIIWVRDGYALHVSDDSQNGFTSNYNNLYSTDDGVLVHWQKEFADLYDWQAELGQDLDSLGYTTVHPDRDDPMFVDLAGDDFRVTTGATGIDAGDPGSDHAVEEANLTHHGGRVNLGAYGNTSLAAESAESWVDLAWPVYHVDWLSNMGAEIRWESYNVDGDVRLTVEDADTGATVATIGDFAVEEGSTLWSPDNSSLPGDPDERYRLRVTSVDDQSVTALMRESFAVLDAETVDYYVNDDATADDQYTTAVGDNRNTGTTADDPKASLLAMLRMYSLGPNDTVHVDTGDYLLPASAVISGVSGVGDDEGVTITGPTEEGRQAVLDRGLSLSGSTVVELHGADFTTLRHLSLVNGEVGLRAHSDSTFFDGSHLEVSGAGADGIVLSSASGSTLSDLHVHHNGDRGVVVETQLLSLTDSHIHDNPGTGIYLHDVGDVVVQGNVLHDNHYAIDVDNGSSGTTTLIGSTDLEAGLGNRIYDNRGRAVHARDNVLVAGNHIYGHEGLTAVYLVSGADATHNVITDSRIGVYSVGTSEERIAHNRISGSSHVAIHAEAGTEVIGNVVHDNERGIDATGSGFGNRQFRGVVANNIIHGSQETALYVHSSRNTPQIVNNTIYEMSADAIVINNNTTNVKLRNNIVQVHDGRALSVGTASHVGFSSDFNLFYITGAGTFGAWQGVPIEDLAAWRSATFNDRLSIEQDPQFVDAAAGDFHLRSEHGSYHGGTLAPTVDGATLLPVNDDGTLTMDGVSSPGIDRGHDDDAFDNEPEPSGGFINLGAFGNTSQASLSPEEYVLLISPAGDEVWPAEQSFPIIWRSHELSAPNLLSNGSADEPLVGGEIPGWTEVVGDNWRQRTSNPSPQDGDSYFFAGAGALAELQQEIDLSGYAAAIDGGDQSFEFEGFVRSYNQGSPDSSRIVVEYLDSEGEILDAFDSGEVTSRDAWERVADARVAPEGSRSVRIRLIATRYSGTNNDGYFDGLSFKPVNTIQIELLQHDGSDYTPVRTIASHERNDGEYIWTIPGDITPDDNYKVRITPSDAPHLSDQSLDPFAITEPVTSYYVNLADDPDLTDNVYTTAAGDNITNDGLSPSAPMASIRAVLETYDLGEGHTIFVDTGEYQLTTNILVEAADAGVAIVGAYDAADPSVQTVIDRNDTSSGSYAFELSDLSGEGDAPSLTLENLHITGGYYGIYADRDAGAHDVHIVNSSFAEHDREAINADYGNHGWRLTGNTFVGHSTAAELSGDGHTFIGNTFRDATSRSLYVRGDGLHIEANIFHDNRTGLYSTSNTGLVLVDNEFYRNDTGAEAWGDNSVVAGNVFYEHEGVGLDLRGSGSVAGASGEWEANEFYDNSGGLNVRSGAYAIGNLVYNNGRGLFIDGVGNSGAVGNIIYGNSGYGINARHNALVSGNIVYDNGRGIDAFGASFGNRQFRGEISNNLIYNNATAGIRVDLTSGTPQIVNNTIVQPSGVGIEVRSNVSSIDIRNNIVQVGDGVVLRIDEAAQLGYHGDYNLYHVTGTADLFEWGGEVYDTRAAFFHATGHEAHGVVGDPAFVDAAADDYHLLPSSLGIDAGDPASPFGNEPTPNGGRVNIGAYGNTTEATPGTSELLQILAPHALDKHELGGRIDLIWRTYFDDLHTTYGNAVAAHNPVAYYRFGETDGAEPAADASGNDLHGSYVDGVELDVEGIFAGLDSAARFAESDNHVQVDDVAGDLDLTQNVSLSMWFNFESTNRNWAPLVYKGDGSGDGRTFALWLNEDGFIRLDTADGSGLQTIETDAGIITPGEWHHVGAVIDRDAGQMHIYLDGERVATGSVRMEEAVSNNEPLYIMASNEGQYHHRAFEGRLDEVAIFDKALTAGDVHEHAVGYRGTVDVELLVDNGDGTYTPAMTIASGLDDVGELAWDVPTDTLTADTDYVIRITSSEGSQPFDQTEPFRFAPDGYVYYVNDGSVANDQYTAAVGDDANHGKSADAPMASLAALLDAYELGADDTVYVDSGLYELTRNIEVSGLHSGVTIVGAEEGEGGTTTLDRGSRAGGRYVFDLEGVTGLTLEHLHVTNADIGVYAARDAGAHDLTLLNNTFYANYEAGVSVDRGSNGLVAEQNLFYGPGPDDHSHPERQDYGLYFGGHAGVVRHNVAHGHYFAGFELGASFNGGDDFIVEHNTAYNNRAEGISARHLSNAVFQHNTVYNNDVGVEIGGTNTITNTEAYGNTIGIYTLNGNVLVTDNHLIYDNNVGIHVGTGNTAEGNTVYGNNVGIRISASSYENSYAIDNLVHDNNYGIYGNRNSVITHNVVHGNTHGIYGNGNYGSNGHFRGTIAHNVVYDSTNYALRIINTHSSGAEVLNNTFVHGDEGTAVRFDGNANDVTFENNIVRSDDADLLWVSGDSQLGFASDYNLFDATGSGALFRWGDIEVNDHSDWFYEIGYDAHSIVGDPRFVDAAANDYRLLPSSPGIDAGNPDSAFANEPSPNGGRINMGAFGNTAEATPSTSELLQILSPHVFDKHQFGRTLDLVWRTHFDDLDADYADLIAAQNPLLHYRLNEEDGAVVGDASGNGHDGELVDGGTWGADGVFGPGQDTAVDFEGTNNHIRVEDTGGSLDLTRNVSAGMWLNIDSMNSATRWMPLLYKGGGNNADDRTFTLWLNEDGHLHLTTADDEGSQTLSTDPGIVSFGEWHHVGAVIDRDAGEMHIYLNGEQVASGAVRTTDAVSSSEPLYIMRSGEGGYYNRPFNGRMDEVTLYDRVLSEAEVHEQAVGYRGTVDVELLIDQGDATYSVAETLAQDLADEGELAWDIPTEGIDAGLDYVIRVTSSRGGQPSDQTEPFRFAGDGNIYYINDGSLDNDVHTTALGDNLNTGKAADDPMASLNALLAVYDVGHGDTIYVDSGTYVPLQNIVLGGEHSGVTIVGAHDAENADAETIIDRGNRSGGYYGFELTGATDVTFERMHVTNASIGIYGAEDAGNHDLTIRDSVFSYNDAAGVRVLRGNDNLLVEGSTFHGNNGEDFNDPQRQRIGLHYEGSGGVVRENVAYEHYDAGFELAITYGASSGYLVEDNIAHDNRDYGIYARGADQSTFRRNTVYDNGTGVYISGVNTVITETHAYGNNIGIESQDDTLITNNHQIYGNNLGIYGHNQTRIENNTVFDNNNGILASSSSSGTPTLVANNWSFNNSGYGIAGNRTAQIIGNRVFDNRDGIRGTDQHGSGGNRHFRGLIQNNLVYANEDVGILLNGTTGSGNARVIGNTVYQEVGNAVRIMRSPSDVTLTNNILWADLGVVVDADEDLSDRLFADHNVYYRGEEGEASVVSFAGTTYADLAAWQAAYGAHNVASVEGDPLFVNMDGANDVLGSSREGAMDDNFRLAVGSPAIDRGHSWWASGADIDGFARTNDPGATNVGSQDYYPSTLPDNHFDDTVGVAENWRSTGNSSWSYAFGDFSFSYYGESYDRIRVGNNGVISVENLSSHATDHEPTEQKLRDRLIIAPFWTELSTATTGSNNIFIDEQAEQLTIRWRATHEPSGETAEFSATLFSNGEVRFDYGQLPADLAAVIGISRGTGEHYVLSDLSGETGVGESNSRSFFLAPGHVDIGAYEFRGSSLDDTPPTVEGVDPVVVGEEGVSSSTFDRIVVDFTEVLDAINANAPQSYRLMRAGSDGTFTESIDLLPQYSAGQSIVNLDVVAGELEDGTYELTIFGDNGVTDLSGISLDGDGDDVAGGDFVRTFTIDTTAPVVAFDSLTTTDASPQLSGTVDDEQADVTVATDGEIYAATNNGDGTWTLAADELDPLEPGEYDVTVTATDAAGNVGETTVSGGLVIEATFTGEVVGRYVFYDNSWFDGEDAGASAADDDAIATDKQALLAGETASFAHYTSYTRGINGVMIDIADLGDAAALTLEDFAFAIGNSDDVTTWADAPLPVTLAVREGEGVSGADRATLIWEDGAIANTWLEVRVAAGDTTGLAEEDVFYFGNAIGETGDAASDAHVTVEDEQAVAANPHGPYNPAAVNSPYDFNRDALVNVQDRLIARANQTDTGSALSLITPTEPAPEPDTHSEFDIFQQYAASVYTGSNHLSTGGSGTSNLSPTRTWSRPLWMEQQDEDSDRKRRYGDLLETTAREADAGFDALSLVKPIAIVR